MRNRSISKFSNPAANIVTFWIPTFRLFPGIKDSEIGLSIRSSLGSPLPASVFAGRVAIDKMPTEETFTEFPVSQQIFCEEARDDHSDPVVHPAGTKKLPNPGVNNWKPCTPLTPCGKMVRIVLPVKIIIFLTIITLKYSRIFFKNSVIELTPDELV